MAAYVRLLQPASKRIPRPPQHAPPMKRRRRPTMEELQGVKGEYIEAHANCFAVAVTGQTL